MEQEIQPGLLPVVTNPLHFYIPHVFNEFQFPLPTKSLGVMKVVVREVRYRLGCHTLCDSALRLVLAVFLTPAPCLCVFPEEAAYE